MKMARAVSCVACLILTLKYGLPFEASEFSGGRITGPILAMEDIGSPSVPSRNSADVHAVPANLWRSNATRVFALFAALPLLCLSRTLPLGISRRVFGTASVERCLGEMDDRRIVCLAIAASFGFRDLLRPISATKAS